MTEDSVPGGSTPAEQRFRLLVVTSDRFPPQRVDVSVLFGEELAGRGHKIDWILQSDDVCPAAYTTAWGGGKVLVGPTDLGTSRARRLRKNVMDIIHDLRLFTMLRSGDYDVVEVKDKFVAGIYAAVAARVFRVSFVYWLSYPFPEADIEAARDGTARYPFLYRIRGELTKLLLYKVLLPAADHVFVQSEQMRRNIASEGIPLDKMTTIPMGIKLDRRSTVPGVARRTLIPEDVRCILYLGTLAKVRRMDFVIRVLAKVRTQVPKAKLYLVGSGEDPTDESALTEEAKRLNVLSEVVFVGRLPQEKALQYVREADVCVSPIYPTPILDVGSPTKLVEYMAMGKAVVANDHPEQRLVIEQSHAGYCVPYEEGAFAEAIIAILASPDEARRMGERGRAYVAKHRAYDAIADTVERELFRITASPAG